MGIRVRNIVAMVALLGSLSGCGCVIDPGDSTDVSAYVDGCWSAARRDNRR
ncbi:MAG: hypothetical protein ACN2B6_06125 [Rickettsiales bacterium]